MLFFVGSNKKLLSTPNIEGITVILIDICNQSTLFLVICFIGLTAIGYIVGGNPPPSHKLLNLKSNTNKRLFNTFEALHYFCSTSHKFQ